LSPLRDAALHFADFERVEGSEVVSDVGRRRPNPLIEGSRVVDVSALERINSGAQVRQARFVKSPHFSFQSAVATALGARQDSAMFWSTESVATKIFSRESSNTRSSRLIDRRPRPQGRLDVAERQREVAQLPSCPVCAGAIRPMYHEVSAAFCVLIAA
jgi:hypothetical protein